MNRFRKHYKLIMTVLAALLLCSAVAALCMGQFRIPAARVLAELTGHGEGARTTVHTTIFRIRIPRVLLSILAGAGLSAAGAAFQSLFSNPLATPDTLGTANGASFGAALAILFGAGAAMVQLMALAAGVLSVLLVFAVTGGSAKGGRRSMIMVVLAGMVVSSLFSAMVSFIKYVADPQDVLPVITFWLMGSFAGITKKSLLMGAPLIIAGSLMIFALRYRLNILSLPEDEAKSLGVNVKLLRILVIGASAAVTASVVSMCGVIGWVGLLVPHIGRMLFGNDNSRVIPFSLLFGGLFMLLTDTAARCMTASEVPVSILTAVIGAPVFIILLRRTGGIRS